MSGLQAGDIVLFITDGFFEWENAAGEQFGFDRLADAVRKFSHLPPEEIIAEIYNSVLSFAAGAPQKDDLTAVLIKRTGGPTGQVKMPVEAASQRIHPDIRARIARFPGCDTFHIGYTPPRFLLKFFST